jgi:hypothetical protein
LPALAHSPLKIRPLATSNFPMDFYFSQKPLTEIPDLIFGCIIYLTNERLGVSGRWEDELGKIPNRNEKNEK